MLRTRQLSELRNDAYLAADQSGFTNRFPSSEVNRYINQGIAAFWDRIVSRRGYAFFGKPWYNMGTVGSSGTSPPVVTVTGSPKIGTATTFVLQIDVVTGGSLGTMTFKYSADNGTTWSSTYTSPTGGTFYAPDIHLVFTFASGTYNSDNLYTSTAAKPTTTSGKVTYDLPADFYKLHKLWLNDGTTSYSDLTRLEATDESYLRSTTVSDSATYYQERDGYIDILPAPGGSYTINMLYVPKAPILGNDTDTFDGINGWEDYPVLYAARKMALKDYDFELANMLQQDLNKLDTRIDTLASDRVSGEPKFIRDVRGAMSWKKRFSRWRGV